MATQVFHCCETKAKFLCSSVEGQVEDLLQAVFGDGCKQHTLWLWKRVVLL